MGGVSINFTPGYSGRGPPFGPEVGKLVGGCFQPTMLYKGPGKNTCKWASTLQKQRSMLESMTSTKVIKMAEVHWPGSWQYTRISTVSNTICSWTHVTSWGANLKKCNLTLAMSPLCNSISSLPLPISLLYIIAISHVDGSNSMVLSSYKYFLRYEFFSNLIFGLVQMDGRTDRWTDRKRCIWTHRATCTEMKQLNIDVSPPASIASLN